MQKILVILKLVLFLSMFNQFALAQVHLTKQWHGTLDVGATKLRLWLEINRSNPDKITATIDSIDQSLGNKIPVKNLVMTNSTMKFEIPLINASYSGKWNESKTSWLGTFKQGRALTLEFKPGPPPMGQIYHQLNGVWRSEIKGHPLLITVSSNKFGTKATLASPDEGVKALPISDLKQTERNIAFKIPYAGVKFEGELNSDNSSFTGIWRQNGQPRRTLTFILQSNGNTDQVARPQMPKGQVPYQIEQVTFTNHSDEKVTLAGTLTIPNKTGRFPAAILISGSGPQDRDETIMEHKPFAVIADQLTRQGIAVLRYDDRGVNKSSGNHHIATSLDFASDANSAFKFLQSHSQIIPDAIGFIGHSEGGLIAPLASKSNSDIAFIIMLAGPGINSVDLMLNQQRAIAKLQNISSSDLNSKQEIAKTLMLAVKEAKTPEMAQDLVSKILTKDSLTKLQATPEQKEQIANSFLSPWYQYFIKYEPKEYFQNKSLPILAFYGELDVQVTARENYAGLAKLLDKHNDKEIILMPKLNHLFQEAKTGAVTEYRKITQTMSPVVLDKMSEWINARF